MTPAQVRELTEPEYEALVGYQMRLVKAERDAHARAARKARRR